MKEGKKLKYRSHGVSESQRFFSQYTYDEIGFVVDGFGFFPILESQT